MIKYFERGKWYAFLGELEDEEEWATPMLKITNGKPHKCITGVDDYGEDGGGGWAHAEFENIEGSVWSYNHLDLFYEVDPENINWQKIIEGNNG